MRAVMNLKAPKFPSEIDDKKVEKAYKDFLKALEEIQKIAAETQKKTAALMEPVGVLNRVLCDKAGEKNLDPKIAKALKALTSAVGDADDKIGRFMIF
jgi:chemotaxis regulatin CheY-phosphate phosphatase CheZ